MLNRRFVLTACAVAVAALITASSTQAWSSLTRVNYLTFNSAVSLPGVVLASGSYAFEAGPGGIDNNIVRVTTRDGQRTLYMGFTMPVSRPADARGTAVSFGEAPAGQPTPIKAWFPAWSSKGYEFRY